MTEAARIAGLSGTRLVAAAIALTPAERTRVVETFFVAHPGAGEGRYGLGRAVLDFQSWEVASGRIDGNAGSNWWRGVNGLMVIDIAAALEGVRRDEPGVVSWLDFAATPEAPQEALWEAHQRSLHRGVRVCSPLLFEEPEAERTFAAIVVEVVDRTAISNGRTDSGELARMTDRFYPKEYPVSDEALQGVQRMRARTADTLRDQDGKVISSVGLDSDRWS